MLMDTWSDHVVESLGSLKPLEEVVHRRLNPFTGIVMHLLGSVTRLLTELLHFGLELLDFEVLSLYRLAQGCCFGGFGVSF